MVATRSLLLLLGAALLLLVVLVASGTGRQWKAVTSTVTRQYVVLTGEAEGDPRGWIVSPMLALGITSLEFHCVDLHVGTILPNQIRGNHRHRTKTEVLMTWGAKAYWRIENPDAPNGYDEVHVEADQQLSVALPPGTAHLIHTVDEERALFISGCADMDFDPANPDTDYDIWPDMVPDKGKATTPASVS